MQIVQKNNQYGLADDNNKIIVEPVYEKIEKWCRARYMNDGNLENIPESYLLYKNNKVGIANTAGVLLEPTYDEIDNIPQDYIMCIECEYPAYKVRLNNKYGYIDFNGKELCEIKYNEPDQLVISSKIVILDNDDKSEIINLETGNIIFVEEFGKIMICTVKYNKVAILIDNTFRFIDENGNIFAKLKLNDKIKNHTVSYLNDKLLQYGAKLVSKEYGETNIYGLIDYEGNILSDLIYDEITPVLHSDCVICHRNQAKTGSSTFDLINGAGTKIIKEVCSIEGNEIGENSEFIPPLSYYETEDDIFNENSKIIPDSLIHK